LGAGFDSYSVTSIPAFVDVRKYFGKDKSQFFVYVDGGMNFTLHNKDYPKKLIGSNQDAYIFKPSLYQEAGIGISRHISKTAKFFISAGYSVKQFKYSYPNYWSSTLPTAYTQYNFNFRRWHIQFGLEF
jgi:hypothetical protein